MTIDLNVVQAKDPILGQDFLTWLWYVIDRTDGTFTTPNGDSFNLYMEQRVSVQGGSSESGLETATVSGPYPDFREARLGLRTGKKVNRASLRLESAGESWTVQLKAEDLSLNSLRTPKVETKTEEGEDPDARFLEKIYLIERFLDYFDSVYARFVRLRLDPKAWAGEVERINAWLKEDPS